MTVGLPRDIVRSALRFRASGGCVAGCEDCRYGTVCGPTSIVRLLAGRQERSEGAYDGVGASVKDSSERG